MCACVCINIYIYYITYNKYILNMCIFKINWIQLNSVIACVLRNITSSREVGIKYNMEEAMQYFYKELNLNKKSLTYFSVWNIKICWYLQISLPFWNEEEIQVNTLWRTNCRNKHRQSFLRSRIISINRGKVSKKSS